MPLWKIAWRSIQHRSLASGLTAFSMGLGVALVVAVIIIYGVLSQSFRRNAQGYNLIVGPKGNSIELVLATMFYSGSIDHTIPYSYFKELDTGTYSANVEAAIPVALGEHYRGMPVVATTPDFFTKLRYMDDRQYQFHEGGNMNAGGEFNAIIGYTASRRTGLKIGDKFKSSHGSGGGHEHEDEFTIVGILKPTGTPNDQALFINIEGFFKMHAHDEEHQGAVAKIYERTSTNKRDQLRISAVLVLTKERDVNYKVELDRTGTQSGVSVDRNGSSTAETIAAMALKNRISSDLDAQAANPVEVISFLMDTIVGKVQVVLIILAVLVVVVAGIGMMVSIYNSMNERRHEIAVMRALGARRLTVMLIILLESILLSLGGGLIGLVIGHGLMFVLGPTIAEAVNIVINPLDFHWHELILVPGLIALASIVGYLPAVIAYRTDVAQSLST